MSAKKPTGLFHSAICVLEGDSFCGKCGSKISDPVCFRTCPNETCRTVFKHVIACTEQPLEEWEEERVQAEAATMHRLPCAAYGSLSTRQVYAFAP